MLKFCHLNPNYAVLCGATSMHSEQQTWLTMPAACFLGLARPGQAASSGRVPISFRTFLHR